MPKLGRFSQPVTLEVIGHEGGLNLIKDAKDLENNEVQDCKNNVSEPGYNRPRGPQDYYSTVEFPHRNFRELSNYIGDTGDDNTLVLTGNELIFVKPTVQYVLYVFQSTPTQALFKRKKKDIYLYNNLQNLVITPSDSSPFFTVRNLGIATPTNFNDSNLEEVPAPGGVGLTGGVYEYTIALINKGGDGKVISNSGVIASALITITAGNATRIKLEVLNIDPQITHFRLYRAYRTTEEGATFTTLFEIADINYATQYYTDELLAPATNALLANDILGFGPINPTIMASVEVGENVVFAVDNEVRYNQPFGGFYQEIYDEATGFFLTPNGRNVTVIWALLKDHLIFTASKTYLWPQTDPNFSPEPIPGDIGCETPHGVVEYNEQLLVLTKEKGKHGLRFVDNTRYSNEDLSKVIQPLFNSITDFTTVVLTSMENDILMAYNDDNTLDYNNKIAMLRYHPEKNLFAWHKWENIRAQYFSALENGTVIYIDALKNRIVMYDQGTDDLGEALDWFITTKDYSYRHYITELDKFTLHGIQGVGTKFMLQPIVDSEGKSQLLFLEYKATKTEWNKQHTDGSAADAEALVPTVKERRWDKAVYSGVYGNRIAFKIGKNDEIFNKDTLSPKIGKMNIEFNLRMVV